MSTINTYVAKGLKLSFKDSISNVFPVDTPIYSAAKNGKATARFHTWQHEVLDTPAQNASVEGDAAYDDAQLLTTEASSNCQIFEKVAKVTDSNEAVGKYGRKSDLARQEMLKGKALMNDIEYAYSHSQAADAGTATTERVLTSFYNQLDSSVTTDGNAVNAQGLLESDMLATHEKTYNQGGNPTMFIVPASEGTTVASWATTAAGGGTDNRIRDFGTGKELTNCVELLVTPYGRMTVVLSRFQQKIDYDASADTSGQEGNAYSTQDGGIALLVDPMYVENAELRPMRRKTLGSSGSSESTLIDWEGTLAVTSPFAHGCIYGFRDTTIA